MTDLPSEPTLVSAWKAAQIRLKAIGLDSPAIDARLLLEAAAGIKRSDILTDTHRVLTDEQLEQFEAYLKRRENREPVGRILGRKAFWKIMVGVTPDVLEPRQDSETLVETALDVFEEGFKFTMLDMGVGSGAIMLAILSERPAAKGVGTDISEEAIAVARDNASNLGLSDRVTFLRTSWADGLSNDLFDLVISNPPYIRSQEIDTLDPEVRDHDPRMALDGGETGMSAYEAIAPEVMRVLKPGGVFAVEIGHDQAEEVQALLTRAGAKNIRVVQDLGMRDRVVTGSKAES